MYSDIEQLVLSGELFNGPERSTSPVRSRSPSPTPENEWPTEKGYEADDGYDSATERNKQVEKILGGRPPQESIGMGPGRTGVKGVIRDRDEAREAERARRAREVDALNRKMERTAITARTWREDEREREWEKARLEGTQIRVPSQTVFGERKGRFGHLREVGVGGFVPAVEQEERGTWVVVHLYDPSVDRCYTLDDTLSRLARRYPDTKFIRVRASALGFATKQPSSSSTRAKPSGIRRATRTIREDDDDDDPFGDEKSGFVGRHEDDESERSSDEDDDNVDTDMLPTMLVYRDGELVFNWVRVDFEAGQAGIEELLLRHHVLPTSGAQNNCGLPSDDELFDDD